MKTADIVVRYYGRQDALIEHRPGLDEAQHHLLPTQREPEGDAAWRLACC